MRDRIRKSGTIALIAVLTGLWFWAVRGLVLPGFIPTHDGEYHLIRFWQFHKMLSLGVFFPQWAPDVNYGYGLPLFIFQYPFPNYAGSLFHALGVSLADSVRLTLLTGYTGAMLFCYLWLRALFGRFAAGIGTAICMFVPYWFVNMYVRGSVGEMLAVMWVFLYLWAVEKGYARFAAIAMGLLIITHNISALMFLPVMVLYLLLRRMKMWSAAGIGLGLAAYFWIPALLERQYVTGLNSVQYRDYFPAVYELLVPSWGTGFRNITTGTSAMSVQIGVVPLVVISVSFFMSVAAAFRSGVRKQVLFWGVVWLGSVFLMLRLSDPLWQSITIIQYIQYPWRFLMITGISAAFFGAVLARRLPVFAAGLVFLGILATVRYVQPVVYEQRNDAYYLSRPNFIHGTSSMGDAFSTIWMESGPDEAISDPVSVVSGDVTLSEIQKRGNTVSFRASARSEALLHINTAYYPGWMVEDNGTETAAQHDGGIISVSVDPGEHTIHARFTATPLRRAAAAVSVISVLYLFALGRGRLSSRNG